MLLNPKKIHSNSELGPRDLNTMDPFDAPIPGQSLTDEPGKWPWDQPPQMVDVDDAYEYVVVKIEQNPDLKDDMLKFLMAKVPIESICNTIAFTGFSQGLWNPDIAEMIKFPLSAYFAMMAEENGFEVVMFNKEEEPTVTDEQIMDTLRENDPEALEFIQQELFASENVEPSFLDELPEEMEEPMTEENMMAMIDVEGGAE
jgi:hypothetical protein